jgi:hypothetical protein
LSSYPPSPSSSFAKVPYEHLEQVTEQQQEEKEKEKVENGRRDSQTEDLDAESSGSSEDHPHISS